MFHIHPGDPAEIVIEGGSERFDRVGEAMHTGVLTVRGDVGQQAGRLMAGGRLVIQGNAGGWAASGLRGGMLEITGDAGPFLGGPLAGERTGMRGGVVLVRGSAGERAADRLRRGLVVVEGDAGVHAGSGMFAGTLVVCGRAGALPGILMRRGTIVLGAARGPRPEFRECRSGRTGVHALAWPGCCGVQRQGCRLRQGGRHALRGRYGRAGERRTFRFGVVIWDSRRAWAQNGSRSTLAANSGLISTRDEIDCTAATAFRHGRACPGHLSRQCAGKGGPDEPGDPRLPLRNAGKFEIVGTGAAGKRTAGTKDSRHKGQQARARQFVLDFYQHSAL